jgi:NAD-dependent SIR2 family protein deacetylase
VMCLCGAGISASTTIPSLRAALAGWLVEPLELEFLIGSEAATRIARASYKSIDEGT